jgi:hypothetical protein
MFEGAALPMHKNSMTGAGFIRENHAASYGI